MAAVRRRGTRKPAPPVAPVPDVDFDRVLGELEARGRPFEPEFLRSVYEFSAEMHRDQIRRSGEPYFTHPLQVAYILAASRFDQVCVAVGLLHDVLEDTLTSRDVLEERFGSEIAGLVDGVTKIGRHEYVRRDQAQAETFRKLILASVQDVRVILVKLADRLHNMQTLEHMPEDARRRISSETLEIYAPIAHRLGMAKIQGDLEDLAFYHLYPQAYGELEEKVREKMKVGRGFTEEIRDRLEETLTAAEIDAEISYRVKRYYSIYGKLRRQKIDIAQLYDYLAFRIITRDLKSCYAALGEVHQNWRPVPGRFKDYIAMPKPNLYQSLHTTVVGTGGQPFEVQIRTRDMDLVAEEGIAAHWRYKGDGKSGEADRSISWLRQLLEWQQEVEDPRTFLTTLKVDLYPDEVYVFSPKGAVFSFPRGATPLDFAYKIHTELGHQCTGARVNGKLVPLKTPLANGDIVEITTSAGRRPSRDWLNFVATSRAKSKIRQWLNAQQKKRAMEIGRKLLEREFKRHKASPKRIYAGAEVESLLTAEGLARIEDLWSAIGFGKLAAAKVVARLLPEDQLATVEEKPGRLREAVSRILPFAGDDAITVRGHGDLLAYLAKCCNPVPGDEIVGFITRGRGVSVHSVECSNVKKLLYNPEREIEVAWARPKGELFAVTLAIETEDKPGMLAKLTEVMAKLDSDIRHIEADTRQPGRGLIEVVMDVRDRRHLDKVRRAVRQLKGVLDVRRLRGGRRRRRSDA